MTKRRAQMKHTTKFKSGRKARCSGKKEARSCSTPPELSQPVLVAIKLVSVATSDTRYAVGLWSYCTIGVLPHCLGFPVRWNYGCGTVLGQPKPAVCQNGIFVDPEKFLDVMT